MIKKRGKNKLDEILNLQKRQFLEQKKIEALEKKQLMKVNEVDIEEHEVEGLEKKQLKELEELKQLELKIKERVGEHPLRKITYKDVGKSMIGAFVGIVSHYTVLEGLHFADDISLTKANFFLLISFLVGLIMIYYTGFRKVKDVRLFAILPFRLLLVYAVTIIAILIVLLIFGFSHYDSGVIYRQVAVLSLPAIIGACAADLIGGD
ncbi:DUF2391 family protein [Candidatus Woesearchaeota archaeon]|nr:DUF2391 family protein [Candidatus Woesearchaeota archaeon]